MKKHKTPANSDVEVIPADPKLHAEAQEEQNRPMRIQAEILRISASSLEKQYRIEELENVIMGCQERIETLKAEVADNDARKAELERELSKP